MLNTCNNVYSLSCKTEQAPAPYFVFPEQCESEIEKAAEMENKSVLIIASSGCMYNLPVPVVTPYQTMILTGEFKIICVYFGVIPLVFSLIVL